VLVRTRGFGSKSKPSWLLIKHRDAYASDVDITAEKPYSALSGRLLADIARDSGGNIEQAATGDPQAAGSAPAKRSAAKNAGAKKAAKKASTAKATKAKSPSIWHSNKPKR
jgi:hypothetical protein